MESFIVRIYRRPRAGAAGLSGTVECVGSGRKRGFSGRDELVELLAGGVTSDDDGADPPPPRPATGPRRRS